MNAPIGSMDPGTRDWSRVDTERWGLGGLGLDGMAGTLADLLDRVRTSPDWGPVLAGKLHETEAGTRDHLRRRVEEIDAERADLDRALTERLGHVERRKEALLARGRRAAAPPRLAPAPGAFALGVRVTADRTTLGVPGLGVRLGDPRGRGTVLATGVTDADGNAVLLVEGGVAEELASARVEATVEVLDPRGQVIQRAERAVSPRPNRTETWVGSAKRSADLEPRLTLATRAEGERQARLTALTSQGERLRAARAARLTDLDGERAEVVALLAALGATPGPPASPSPPPASPAPSPPTRPGPVAPAVARPPMPRPSSPRRRPRGPA